jgi:G3E family GTPase
MRTVIVYAMTDTDPDPRIPVTVLTGFLGSGKTTLLNRILTEQHGLRIAVVENEFGEVGIDDALVIDADEEVFEMNNGCICCTVRGDLIRILGTLAKRRDRFDRVIIETTGLADPAPVAQTFFVDHEVAQEFRLDAIITLVDAKHAMGHLRELKPEGVENESVEQVAFADRIVLNKLDLVTAEQAQEVADLVGAINPSASIVRAVQADVPLPQILDVRAFDLDRVLTADPSFLEQTDHMHDLSVGSVGITSAGAVDGDRFNSWLGQLLSTRGIDIFRSKGILNVAGFDERLVFQGVHMLIDSTAGPQWKAGEDRSNRLVFIGRNLDRAELEDGFRACLVGSGAPA